MQGECVEEASSNHVDFESQRKNWKVVGWNVGTLREKRHVCHMSHQFLGRAYDDILPAPLSLEEARRGQKRLIVLKEEEGVKLLAQLLAHL